MNMGLSLFVIKSGDIIQSLMGYAWGYIYIYIIIRVYIYTYVYIQDYTGISSSDNLSMEGHHS